MRHTRRNCAISCGMNNSWPGSFAPVQRAANEKILTSMGQVRRNRFTGQHGRASPLSAGIRGRFELLEEITHSAAWAWSSRHGKGASNRIVAFEVILGSRLAFPRT